MATGHACKGRKPDYPTSTIYSPILIARQSMISDIMRNPITTIENKMWRIKVLTDNWKQKHFNDLN